MVAVEERPSVGTPFGVGTHGAWKTSAFLTNIDEQLLAGSGGVDPALQKKQHFLKLVETHVPLSILGTIMSSELWLKPPQLPELQP